MTSSDDEDFKRAIALSLGEPDPGVSHTKEIIDLSDDEQFEEEVGQKSGVFGLLGLNRAQMEAERLARKRKASSPPTDALLAPKTSKTSAASDNLQYPKGVLKRTWVKGQPRIGDDVTLGEVLQPSTLRLAILSSFQWDIPWLYKHLRSETKIVLVMQAKDEETKRQYHKETEDVKNLRLCFPSMEGQINCMHSKLMVLSYEGHLRIVVPTANLVPYDWGETGTMENCAFMIDLPRLKHGERRTKAELTSFGSELIHFLEAQGLEQKIVDSLCGFDFNETRDMAFVHTIGGANAHSWSQTGYVGLALALRALDLDTKSSLRIDYITSSVGSLNMPFLTRFYLACRGETMNPKHPTSKAKMLPHDRKTLDEAEAAVNQDFHIYFPTHETVTSSLAGSSGTICMQSSYYNNPNFPRHLLRDCKSKRQGVLMHNKILYVRPENGQAWAYIGSANLSESAWGNKLAVDKQTPRQSGKKLNCRNWECGVVVKVPRREKGEEDGENGQGGERLEGLDVFEGTVPVPMVWPAEEYGERKPWFFMG